MKKRHLKTIIERYGFNGSIKNKDELIRFSISFNHRLHLYRNYINKAGKEFDLNDALNYCDEKTKGTFYLDADVVYKVQYDDTPGAEVLLNGSDKKWVRFDVLEASQDGWVMVLYFNVLGQLDYEFVEDNKVLLEGNIGTII